MFRRSSVPALVLLSCALLAACAKPSPPPQSDAPRAILLITVDGLIPEVLSVFGGPEQTPGLERIAARGAAWEDGWTASPMTRPSVATYLTGLAPDRHGVRDDLFVPLDSEIPTLAELLGAAGYDTAAFPDSSFLGYSSGLLDGFEVVAQPPPVPISPRRWIPEIREPRALADDFEAWLESVPRGERYFAWVHSSAPMMAEIWEFATLSMTSSDRASKRVATRREEDGAPLEKFDEALVGILALLEARGDLAETLIVVAGTQGSVVGEKEKREMVGNGFSVGDSALRVPVMIAFPDGAAQPVSGGSVWSPDVAATIAELAGVELPEAAEGVSLLQERPADRLQFAWAWAPRDQMGWRVERAVRGASGKWVDGSGGGSFSGAEVEQAEIDRLRLALGDRVEPAAPAVPLDKVRPLLEARGLSLNPIPSEGRAFGDPGLRREITARLLGSREVTRRGRFKVADQMQDRLMGEDPEAQAPMLDLGQSETLRGAPEGAELLGRALQLYPTDPELLHWYGHALWPDSWQDARELLTLIAPYKPNDSDVLYDLACLESLSENLEAAEDYLRQAIDAGYDNFGHIETDPDLRNLRASGRFSEVLTEYKR